MLSKRGISTYAILIASFIILFSLTVEGAEYSLTVSGTDAVFLAGRDDLTIPAPGVQDPSFPLERRSYAPATYSSETVPKSLPIRGGDQINIDALGSITYSESFSGSFDAGPDGREEDTSNYNSVDGISGYSGPHGALLGVFLDDTEPSTGPAPDAIDFRDSVVGSVGSQFDKLYPGLGQVFFIGNGYTVSGTMQTFVAPAGATRVLFGVADGKKLDGVPGYYEDNTGAFEVTAYLPDSAITATVECRPHKLILRNRGRYIKAYIELEEGYDVQEIDRYSVMITEINGIVLEESIPAKRFTRIGDRDRDGIRELKVKFSRKQLVPFLSEGKNEITIVGVLKDGTDFEGIGKIIAEKRHHKKKCKK